jgi:hypothetical protein
MPQGDNQPKADPDAGEAKPDGASPSAEAKPMPKKDGANAKQPDASTTKEPPKDGADPKNPEGAAAEARREPPKQPMGEDKAVEPGMDKAQQQDAQAKGGEGAKKDEKAPGKGDSTAAKLDPKQLQDIKDAAKDLNSPDQGKRDAAREKLDKTVGKANREAIEDFQNQQKQDLEQLAKDLDSKDETTKKAAEQKLKEIQKKAEARDKDAQAKKDAGTKGGKGEERKLSEAELKELVEKARDLTSDNQQKREAAEKQFDDKLGKESREQLQKELEKRKKELDDLVNDPKQREELKKQLEQARKDRKDGKGDSSELAKTGGGADNTPPPSAMESDPRNKLKAAQLQLEDFKREQYGTVPERLNWTPEQYKKFLDDLENRVQKLEKEVESYEEARRAELGKPTIKLDSAGKVDEAKNVVDPVGRKGGAGFAPPGFADPVNKFREAAKKLGQNK